MTPDIKRARTFLSAKGFQWEPILDDAEVGGASLDFKACLDGKPFFCGTVLSIGQEQPWDGAPLTVVNNPEKQAELRHQLTHQLSRGVQRLDALESSELPKVAIIANHEPLMGFEDLTSIIDTISESKLHTLALFIWFDDFRSDKMLFRGADTQLYGMMGADDGR